MKIFHPYPYNFFKEAIENYTGVKCLGFVEKNDKLNIRKIIIIGIIVALILAVVIIFSLYIAEESFRK